jgi:Fic family protein
MSRSNSWIWQKPDWPEFVFDVLTLSADLAEAYRMHGTIEGKAAAIALTNTSELALEAMAGEVVATAAIEGERLSMDAVRSSVMRRLGLAATGPSDRSVDGLVAVLDDATARSDLPLDEERLCRWQSALFPGGTSGLTRIAVGRYREHDDPMQIVSGTMGREVVHYEAPPSRDVPRHMQDFLRWFDATARGREPARGAQPIEGLARAALAHLWFETIHPFEDGNGRIGRAVVDMAVAQHLRQPVRLYSLSRQLQRMRGDYYDNLNAAQRGGLDVTPWVQWFVRQCTAAYTEANLVIDQALEKRRFWERHDASGLNERQRKVLQRLLDAGDGGFLGGLNAEKYTKLTGASKATATRDLADMVRQGQLWTMGAGKALRYYVSVPGWTHGVERGPQA